MKTILTVVIIALSSACTFNTSKQNPEKAAASAVEFAKVAFIDRNVDKAYSLLDPEFQAMAPKEKLNEALAIVNSPTSPKTVTAKEYEPINGQEGMMIYLIGENDSEKFYYRLGMKGTEEKGYKVAGIFRNPEQYPPSELKQPLEAKRSTNN